VCKRGNNNGADNKHIFGQRWKERTATYIAACEGHIEVLHKLWEWARYNNNGGVKKQV